MAKVDDNVVEDNMGIETNEVDGERIGTVKVDYNY